MASKADSSLFTSTINTSSIKQASQKRSLIYKHSRKLNKGELIYNLKKRKYIYCKYCTYSTILTANLWNYLKLKYRIIVQTIQSYIKVLASQKLEELYKQAAAKNKIDDFNFYILKKVLNKEVINQALIDLIIIQNLLLRTVKWLEFYVFYQALNRASDKYLIITCLAVSQIINQLFQL